MACDRKLRLGAADVPCSLDHPDGYPPDTAHEGKLDAYPTRITWFESDRRSYTGDFRTCDDPCTLPGGHSGRHA